MIWCSYNSGCISFNKSRSVMSVCTLLNVQVGGVQGIYCDLKHCSIHIGIFRNFDRVVTAFIKLIVTLFNYYLISLESLGLSSCYETFWCAVADFVRHTRPIGEIQWLTLLLFVTTGAWYCRGFCAMRILVEASCVCWATPAIAAISIVRAAILVIHIAEVVIFLV